MERGIQIAYVFLTLLFGGCGASNEDTTRADRAELADVRALLEAAHHPLTDTQVRAIEKQLDERVPQRPPDASGTIAETDARYAKWVASERAAAFALVRPLLTPAQLVALVPSRGVLYKDLGTVMTMPE